MATYTKIANLREISLEVIKWLDTKGVNEFNATSLNERTLTPIMEEFKKYFNDDFYIEFEDGSYIN